MQNMAKWQNEKKQRGIKEERKEGKGEVNGAKHSTNSTYEFVTNWS